MSVKTMLLTAILAALGVALASYYGVNYFKEHYVLLNEQDMDNLTQMLVQREYQAFRIGLQACNKSI